MASSEHNPKASTIKQQLENHLDFIRQEYVDKDASLEQLMNTILVQLDIKLSKSSLEKSLKQLGVHKYTKGEDWRWVEHRFMKRKRDNKESELLIHNIPISEDKRQKRMRDHVSLSAQLTLLSQPTPPAPDGWSIRTPKTISEGVERTPSPPNSPGCEPDYQKAGGDAIGATLTTLAATATNTTCGTASSNTVPLIREDNRTVESMASREDELAHCIPTFEDMRIGPVFATWRYAAEDKKVYNALDIDSLASLMEKCELLTTYMKSTDAIMLSEEVKTRYRDIAVPGQHLHTMASG
ncbi:hypothetical protein SCUP234_09625 [Seiridium cupressi]